MTQSVSRSPVTIRTLRKMRQDGDKIAMLTCYDATFASLLDTCGVDILLIGDSLGMVMQGKQNTLSVTLDDVIYHVACVSRGSTRAMIVADMPFATFQESPETAFQNAAKILAAGAHMVKLEGGAYLHDTIGFLTERGIPVCAHIGLTPQSVNQLGGYVVQGKTADAEERLIEDAKAIEAAGASLLVIEAVPATLGKRITESVSIPTIGIGAGPDCSGQVLVLYDLLGIYSARKPKFVKNFMAEADSVEGAVSAYVQAVKAGTFPEDIHCFKSS